MDINSRENKEKTVKLYLIEYTWDGAPHGDIAALWEETDEAAGAWLRESLAAQGDDDGDFEIMSISEVRDMVDSEGNGSIEPYDLFRLALHMVAEKEGVNMRGLEDGMTQTLDDVISDMKTAGEV